MRHWTTALGRVATVLQSFSDCIRRHFNDRLPSVERTAPLWSIPRNHALPRSGSVNMRRHSSKLQSVSAIGIPARSREPATDGLVALRRKCDRSPKVNNQAFVGSPRLRWFAFDRGRQLWARSRLSSLFTPLTAPLPKGPLWSKRWQC